MSLPRAEAEKRREEARRLLPVVLAVELHEDWQLDGLCNQVDPEIFFPEKGGSTREAKLICGLCDVSKACLRYALETEEQHGIWGGLSERDRRPFRQVYKEHLEQLREADGEAEEPRRAA